MIQELAMTETNQPTDQQELLKRYLLGNLSESEQDRIEELYFTKDDHLDELLIAENGLLEDYLAGNLTPREARDFQRHYLTTPEKRLRLQLVKRIHEEANGTVKAPADLIVEQPRVEEKSWWQTVPAFLYPRQPGSRFALVFGVLVIVVAAALLVNRNSQLRNQLAQAEQEKSRLQREEGQLRQQLAEQREQKVEIAPSPDPVNEVQVNRDSQLRNQLAQAEKEKSRLQEDGVQLRQQLAEQRRQNDEIAKSLDQANLLLANRNSQLGNQLAQAEQERNRLQQEEAQLRQQLAEQGRRNDEIAKSLDHLHEQRRLLDEELSRQRQAGAAPLPSFELGGGEQSRTGFGAFRSPQPRHKTISIPKEAKLVRMTFNVNTAGFKSYRLSLAAVNGTEVWSLSDELPQSAKRGITLHIPAGVLNPGDYTFKLALLDQDGAMGTPGQYPVRVERQ